MVIHSECNIDSVKKVAQTTFSTRIIVSICVRTKQMSSRYTGEKIQNSAQMVKDAGLDLSATSSVTQRDVPRNEICIVPSFEKFNENVTQIRYDPNQFNFVLEFTILTIHINY